MYKYMLRIIANISPHPSPALSIIDPVTINFEIGGRSGGGLGVGVGGASKGLMDLASAANQSVERTAEIQLQQVRTGDCNTASTVDEEECAKVDHFGTWGFDPPQLLIHVTVWIQVRPESELFTFLMIQVNSMSMLNINLPPNS